MKLKIINNIVDHEFFDMIFNKIPVLEFKKASDNSVRVKAEWAKDDTSITVLEPIKLFQDNEYILNGDTLYQKTSNPIYDDIEGTAKYEICEGYKKVKLPRTRIGVDSDIILEMMGDKVIRCQTDNQLCLIDVADVPDLLLAMNLTLKLGDYVGILNNDYGFMGATYRTDVILENTAPLISICQEDTYSITVKNRDDNDNLNTVMMVLRAWSDMAKHESIVIYKDANY